MAGATSIHVRQVHCGKGREMSSADATVDGTVAMATTVRERGRETTRAATVLAAIAVAQLVWLAVLVYGVISLLT